MGCLASIGQTFAFLRRNPPAFLKVPHQKKRRDNLRKIDTHLGALIDAILDVDNAALEYAFMRGIEEIARASGAVGPECKARPGVFDAGAWKTQNAEGLKAFAFGIKLAIKELPRVTTADRSFDAWVARDTARWLEDHLERHLIPFTTSEDSLAAMSFHVVMRLAGVDTSEAQGARYRLSEAKSSPNSFRAFIEEVRSRSAPAEKAP